MMNFSYLEDRQFFANLLCDGKTEELGKRWSQLFDFRSPLIKRGEFNAMRKRLLPELKLRFHNQCGLQFDTICEGSKNLTVDHLIPLSSNKLNKELRHMVAEPGKKVLTQSFGSNHIDNLVLACSACNAYKKHRFPDAVLVKRIFNEKKK